MTLAAGGFSPEGAKKQSAALLGRQFRAGILSAGPGAVKSMSGL
jgi:hypothetical protein